MTKRIELRISGAVQGVGFRPFVFRLANEFGLAGFVGNDADGVFVELEGAEESIEAFRKRLELEHPPAAVIHRVVCRPLEPWGEREFRIVASPTGQAPRALISPDLDCCEDCLRETLDPLDRRHLYAFTNCTNCGPRYTIIQALPYDRPQTTMGSFEMCDACRAEYEDPRDRRFHAQPNACPECGPQYSMSLEEIAELLKEGEVLAIKGVGGYHLACDARRAASVARIRSGKGRLTKPFAVMVKDLATARSLAVVNTAEEELLSGQAAPIVLLRGRGELPDQVAPGLDTLGVMLPYTPFHHLLFALSGLDALVMTSGNRSGLPICSTRVEAEQHLRSLTPHIVSHNREIEIPCDDSVVRVVKGSLLPMRRSRGYAPFPVKLPFHVPPLLAVGAQMKSTFCLGRGRDAFLSQHLGDLESLETLRYFERVASHLQRLYQLEPEGLVCDLHPDYLSTRWAEQTGLPLFRVQHHHAHLAAIMAEHGLDEEAEVLGVILDGTGYGVDGTVWGGEILRGGYRSFERIAFLKPVPLLGGDLAVREPWRMALSHLWSAGLELPGGNPVLAAAGERFSVVRAQYQRRVNSVMTSSMGRLFDAVAALAGVCQTVEYEAQAAILLEAVARRDEQGVYRFGPGWDAGPLLEQVLCDWSRGESAGTIAMRFHRGVCQAATELVLNHHRGLPVVLSGGVFQNAMLLELLELKLRSRGVTVYSHRTVPPNDGGLALGQLAVAGCQGKE